MSQDLRNYSIGIALNKKCGKLRQNFRHFFCDLRGKPMPIEFIIGLKANQAPNYRNANMVVSPEHLHQPLTKVKTQPGDRELPIGIFTARFPCPADGNGTQSRPCFGLDRQTV